MRRKRLTILFCSAMAVLLIGLPLDGAAAAGAKETAQAEGTALTYKTGNNISAQGENGFYYAWGTPEHYVLMEYGLGWSGSDTWHGTEPYSHIAGSSLHPGDNWGVMVVWVAGGSGKVRLNGHMEKGSSQGDGVTLGVYRQKNEGELETVFEKFVENGAEELKFPLDQEFDVSKGDSFVFTAIRDLRTRIPATVAAARSKLRIFPEPITRRMPNFQDIFARGARATSEAFSISKGDSARK